ncbi:hypothetical protein TWF696_004214 [Orbilia brochopaga]|uniref:Uncharacterized protein n=1 Tax=Orbilia brochopaga TaxID=3140254 RepID=A0AAV9V7T7_9PEZI
MLKIKRWPCNETHADPNLECEICEVIPDGVVIKPSDWPPEAREVLRAANLRERDRIHKPLPITPKPSLSVLKPLEEFQTSESIYENQENKENIDVQNAAHVQAQAARSGDKGPSNGRVPCTPEKRTISPTPSLTSLPSPSSTTILTATAMTIKKIELDDIEVLQYIPISYDEEEDKKYAKATKDKGKERAESGYTKKEPGQNYKYSREQSQIQKEDSRTGDSRDEPMQKNQGQTTRAHGQSLKHGISPIDKENKGGNFTAYSGNHRSVSMPDSRRNPTSGNLLQVPPTDMRTGKALPPPNSPATVPQYHLPPMNPPSYLATNYFQTGRPSSPTPTLAIGRQQQGNTTNKLTKLPEHSTSHRQARFGDYLTVPHRPQHDLRRASYGPRSSSRPRTSFSGRPDISAPIASRPTTSLGQWSDMPLAARPETSMASISTQPSGHHNGDQSSEKKIGKFKKFFRMF